jgi:UDP-4-amino-4,6-dideoxy-N-acetyl-beta-L-altrosamine transaminase
MIPYGRQTISEEDIESVVQVLRSDWITQGPAVPIFEESVAEYCGAEFAVAVNSATSALHVACLAMGVGPRDIVWTSANTFVASANCAVYCGANVDFIDIDPVTYNLSVASLKSKLKEAERVGRLPKVIIPVHFAGQSCEMEEIAFLAEHYGFKILEDASHAIGGRYQDQPVGNCRFSDITVFSFHPVKVITSGEGGMALTNDPNLRDSMHLHRNHGVTSQEKNMLPRPESEIWRYQQIDLGFNYRMTDIHAALGLSQMKRLDEFVRCRHEIAEQYNHSLNQEVFVTPQQHPDTFSSFHLYPIRVRSGVVGQSQAGISRSLVDAEIHINHHYIPVYRHPYFESLGFRAGYCPEAEEYFRQTISLPMFPALSALEQKRVIELLNNR